VPSESIGGIDAPSENSDDGSIVLSRAVFDTKTYGDAVELSIAGILSFLADNFVFVLGDGTFRLPP